MAKKPKFVLIGVGSVIFGAGTVRDLMHFKDEFAGGTICLVDIDPEILELMTAMAVKTNEAAGSPYEIVSSTDRREVLDGADFVVTSPAIRREELWEIDWNIIHGAGIKQTYGENGGPGSLSHTLRNVPMILAICRDIEELCPDAWLLNFTNPEARICMAVARYTNVKFVGLCHQIHEGYRNIAKALDVPIEDLDLKAAGLNHFTWVYDLRRISTGDDLYPALRAAAKAGKLAHEPMTAKMFELTGMFPTPGDHHLAEFLPFGYEFVGLEGRDFKWRRNNKAESRKWLEDIASGKQDVTDRMNKLSGERIVQMALAVMKNRNTFEISMDVVNNGAIPNLPDAAIVETPGVISGMGITPMRMAPLPEVIAECCRRQYAVQSLAVEAAVTGNRATALQAMILDPVVDNVATAETVLDQLLDAHREYVSPAFFNPPRSFQN